jgi:tetratricopeptide (TPR) repeat protein
MKPMMNLRNIAAGILIGILAGCGAPKMLVSYQQNALEETSQGNYIQAVEAWKQHFSQQPVEQTEGAVFAQAAQTAFLAGNENQSIDWFDQARFKNFASSEMYLTLSKIYHSQNNLSKELGALEFYSENFAENAEVVYNRLFEIYQEIDSEEKALQAWAKTSNEFKNEVVNLSQFFRLNQKLENVPLCDSLSLVILEKDAGNVAALEWNAQKYYWLAENRYQQEMEKYNRNKTTKQYRLLLKELDLVTADFKKALPYFEKLWIINPGEKYAGYLANIFARFGDEKKSGYYQRFLK